MYTYDIVPFKKLKSKNMEERARCRYNTLTLTFIHNWGSGIDVVDRVCLVENVHLADAQS